MAADFGEYDIRRVRDLLCFELFRCEQTQRHAEPFGDCVHRRLITFEVNGRDAGHRTLCDTCVLQGRRHKRPKFFSIGIARAPDPDDIGLRMVNQRFRVSFHRCLRHDEIDRTPIGFEVENVLASQRNPFACKNSRHRVFGVQRVGQTIASGRRVKRNTDRNITCGGNGSFGLQNSRNLLRQTVRTTMTAQQRNDDRTVIAN